MHFIFAKIAVLDDVLGNDIALALSYHVEITLSKNRVVLDLLAVFISLLDHLSEDRNILGTIRASDIKALRINRGITKVIGDFYCLGDQIKEIIDFPISLALTVEAMEVDDW